MPWYELLKIVHFLGLIALFGYFVIQTRAGGHLRAATTAEDARTWAGLLHEARPMIAGGFGMMLLSGIIMVAMRWRGEYPFVGVGLVALVILWIVYATIGFRHLRAVRAAVDTAAGPLGTETLQLIRNPSAWALAGALNGAVLGVLFVMTLKPGWWTSVGLVVVLAAVVSAGMQGAARRAGAGGTG